MASEKSDLQMKSMHLKRTIQKVQKLKNYIQSNCIGGKCKKTSYPITANSCSRLFQYFHRDTPHHLKNKRVQQGAIDKTVANILLANAPKQLETIQPNTINDKSISDSNHEHKSSHLNDCGKFWHIIFTTRCILYCTFVGGHQIPKSHPRNMYIRFIYHPNYLEHLSIISQSK